jgi:hypothetical protein
MDGWVNVLDLGSGQLAHRLPVGWRGDTGQAPAEADWEQFDVVTSIQLLPGGQQVLAGCMDGTIQLLDLRSPLQDGAARQLHWSQRGAAPAAPGHPPGANGGGGGGGGGAEQGMFWRRGSGAARLCAARCHDHLMVVGGDAAAVTLHDLRMGGAAFAELALPAGSQRTPAVFAMDLLYPRLATGGDRGQVQVGAHCACLWG